MSYVPVTTNQTSFMAHQMREIHGNPLGMEVGFFEIHEELMGLEKKRKITELNRVSSSTPCLIAGSSKLAYNPQMNHFSKSWGITFCGESLVICHIALENSS